VLLSAASLVLLVWLGGCASTPPEPTTPPTVQVPGPEEARAYEQRAGLAPNARERTVYQFMAAEIWDAEGQSERAVRLIFNLDDAHLAAEQRLSRHLILAEYHRERGELEAAQNHLEYPSWAEDLRESRPPQRLRWAQNKAALAQRLGTAEPGWRAYDRALSLTDLADPKNADAATALRTGLWQTLNRAQTRPAPPYLAAETAGWVALAQITHSRATSLAAQHAAYLRWRTEFADHPARTAPPASVAVLEKIMSRPRPKVALLLPLSGSLATAGQALLDGYLAARDSAYHPARLAPQDPQAPRQIQLFDTARLDWESIAQELQSGQFDLVIGPLDRERVTAYAQSRPALPSLVFNSLPPDSDSEPDAPPAPILGLSLNVESEAQQAATRAFREGHRSALVLAPDGTWGERAGQAFVESWQAQGGIIRQHARYGASDMRAGILERALLVDASHQRHKTLEAQLGQTIEFRPRRRQDVDAIFLAATPAQARQINPLLAFFFAGDLPVYATSSVYSGHPDADANRDLNGIRFTSIPWMLDPSVRPAAEPQEGAAVPSATELKMQAIGFDSYFLAQRIEQFLTAPDSRYRGMLGTLHRADTSRDLQRQQPWAQFRGGRARPVPQ